MAEVYVNLDIPKVGCRFAEQLYPESQIRKREALQGPRMLMLEKLAAYLPCNISGGTQEAGSTSHLGQAKCPCLGWKPFMGPVIPDNVTRDTCRSCRHDKADHYAHIKDLSDVELRRLFGYFYDAETIHISISREEHLATKCILFKVYNALRKALMDVTELNLESVAGPDAIDGVTFQVAVKNMLTTMFGDEGEELSRMTDAFEECMVSMAHWRIDPPILAEHLTEPELTKWMVLCHIPVYCDSLALHNMAQVFGRGFFIKIFDIYKREFMKYIGERGEIVGDGRKRVTPKACEDFLELVQAELKNEHSTVWGVGMPTDVGISPDTSPHMSSLMSAMSPHPLMAAQHQPVLSKSEAQKMIEDKVQDYLAMLTPDQRKMMSPDNVAKLRILFVRLYHEFRYPHATRQPQVHPPQVHASPQT